MRALAISATLLFAALLFAAALAVSDPFPAPLTPAGSGKLQCYAPNTAAKTCKSLAGYKSRADGAIDNSAIVLISASPAITMETVSPVVIKAGRVCGKVEERDIDTAKFTVGPTQLDQQQAEPLRQQLRQAFQKIFGHELCTAYVPEGGVLVAKATMDGAPMGVPDEQVIWVAPDEGYSVSP